MCLDVCLFVCGHKNEHFDQSRPAYELYFLCMSQKSKNISSRTRAYVSEPGKAVVSIFFALLKLHLTLSTLARIKIITRVGDRNSG